MMETSEDAFLGGRLHVRQPKTGYRAGADPVFLAAAADVKPGQDVLELGCGVGVAMLCLLARVPDARVTGLELQPELAELARLNLRSNGMTGEVVTGDACALPPELRARSYDHVLTNPPFFDAAEGSPALDAGRDAGRRTVMSVSDWLDVAIRRLKPGGTLTLINRIERLPDCLAGLGGRMGTLRIRPLAARQGREAKLFLLSARKGAKTPLVLLAPLILHDGSNHFRDEDSYSEVARSVLREGAVLSL